LTERIGRVGIGGLPGGRGRISGRRIGQECCYDALAVVLRERDRALADAAFLRFVAAVTVIAALVRWL
jgi:hypothetical protein